MTTSAFEIVKTLYESAYHHTFLAREPATGRHVWVKRAIAAHPSAADLERLQHESEVSGSLADRGFPCFQMVRRYGDVAESVADNVSTRGHTLREWIDSHGGRFPLADVFPIMLSLVKMLEGFHRQRRIHNNLCPEALWIDAGSKSIVPIDYGFVRNSGVDRAAVYASLGEMRHLAYLSPELSGQLQQPIDFRSDIYSLGVILYELLTGQWPIREDEPIRWLHAKIAQKIIPPHQRAPHVPLSLSRIAMKCLETSPDHRYQSLYGLRTDLENGSLQSQNDGGSTDFEPTTIDIPAHFRISGRFVGRQRELDELAKLMHQLATPGSRLALVSGEPGIGKTALVRELQRIWHSRERLFLFGKFDQVHRDLPFRPWIEAFDTWSRFVLAQSEEEIASWKRAIETLIGTGAPVLHQLIPQMEKITGITSPAKSLEGHELLVRFETVFIDFLRIFSKMGISVVVVLDDLQWADPASAKLVTTILEQEDLSHLLLVGTYRDGTEEQGNVWRGMLDKLKEYGERVLSIRLQSLQAEEVAEWLADTFYCQSEQTRELAERLLETTGGNPFFLGEFLRMLYNDHQIRYDTDTGRWSWDVHELATMVTAHTNVADLLLDRLHRVPPDSLKLLQYAACAGNVFETNLLSKLLGDAAAIPVDVAATELARLGLIVPAGENAYVFAHDRVRLTSYMLLPEQERALTHVRLGQLLLASETAAASDRLFEIVNHLNRGKAYLNEADKEQLISLNLLAGHRAKENTAFDHASLFYQAGIDLLPDNAWQSDYRLTYELKLGRLECAYLAGNVAESELLFQELHRNAQTVEDRTQAYLTQIRLESRRDNYENAIRLGLKALEELGMRVPEHPGRIQLLAEWVRLKRFTIGGRLGRLEQLAPSTDIRHKAIMALIFALGAPTYVRNPDLMVYLALRSCGLTFKSGIFHNSGIGLVAYGVSYVFLGAGIENGLKLGDIAWRLTRQYGTLADKCYTAFMYGAFLHHWGHSLAESETYLEQSIAYSIESGNLEFLGYSATHLLVLRHVRGVPLDKLAEEVERNYKWTGRLKDPHFYDFLLLYRHFLRHLQGKTENILHFDDGEFREKDYVERLSDERKKFDYWLCKVQALYLLGRIDEAWQIAKEAQRLIDSFVGIVNVSEHDFYYCLVLLAQVQRWPQSERKAMWRSLRQKRKRFKAWAATCPSHYVHKLKLIEAEMANARGKDKEAAGLYQEAIATAAEHAYWQNEAIAHECAARFYRRRNNRQDAERHLFAAYRSYAAWGAHAKVGLMLRQYPFLADDTEHGGAIPKSLRPHQALTDTLDVSAVVQASQAISREIVLEELLRQLLTIVLQHSGAERIVLLLARKGEWTVAASGTADAEGIGCQLLTWTPWHLYAELAHAVIEYVDRTRELLVLDFAHADDRFSGDRHIRDRHVQSLLCMPMMQRGEAAGLIYLENRQTGGVFTPRKVELLKLLSSQIAISLQNAMMYERMRSENTALEGAYAETAVTLENTQREAAGTMIEKVILEERSRIAGDIHDTIGHTLTSVLLQIEAGKKLLGKKAEVGAVLTKLDNSQRQLREGLQQLRKTLAMLEDRADDEAEPTFSLETFIQKTMDYTGIQIIHDISPDIQLTAPQKYVLYRALQEGITNGIRHGGASRFDFSLKRSGSQIVFVLRDNGTGNDSIVPGFGLSAMYNRVHELNGRMQMESDDGNGCKLIIQLPVAPESPA